MPKLNEEQPLQVAGFLAGDSESVHRWTDQPRHLISVFRWITWTAAYAIEFAFAFGLFLSIVSCAYPPAVSQATPIEDSVTTPSLTKENIPKAGTTSKLQPTMVTVSETSILESCENAGARIFHVDKDQPLDLVVQNAPALFEDVAAQVNGATKLSVIRGYLDDQDVLNNDLVIAPFDICLLEENLPAFGIISPTGTTEPVTALYGTLFTDWNNTGAFEPELGEKPVVNTRVCVNDLAGELCAFTAEDGSYQIENIHLGDVNILLGTEDIEYSNLVEDFRTILWEGEEKQIPPDFRLWSIGHGWKVIDEYSLDDGGIIPSQRVPIVDSDYVEKKFQYNLTGDTLLDIGLKEGPYVNIHTCEELAQLPIRIFPDEDEREGYSHDYRGVVSDSYWGNYTPDFTESTYDGHTGLDQGSKYSQVSEFWARAPGPESKLVFPDESTANAAGKDERIILETSFDDKLRLLHADILAVRSADDVEQYQIIGSVGFRVIYHIHLDTSLDSLFANLVRDFTPDPEDRSSQPWQKLADILAKDNKWAKFNDPWTYCIPEKYLQPGFKLD